MVAGKDAALGLARDKTQATGLELQGHQLAEGHVDQAVGVHAGIATLFSTRSST